MVSMGGFDTHAQQVNPTDTTTGAHAALLSELSDAIKAFQDDLKYLQVHDRVLGMTFSEFGRRIKSNASGGTDHGAAAPMFLFGSQVAPGITGQNPQIPSGVSVDDNVVMQYDFRSVYATILANWFCADSATLQASLLRNFQVLPLIRGQQCGSNPMPPGAGIMVNYPNPFSSHTTIQFTTAGGHTLLEVYDATGRLLRKLAETDYVAGTYAIDFNASGLPPGVYYARLQNGASSQVRSMLKLK
jgi:hypothetical protein